MTKYATMQLQILIDNLQFIRKQRGWTVREMAEVLGMVQPNLSRLLHGRSVPSTSTLIAISEALEVPMAELWDKDFKILQHAN